VKVPAENLLGEHDMGFQIIMSNFNHERWMIAAGVISGARGIID
jgi:alkylation response protein AidB-like acyl-CoA dehydrogenase